MPSKSRLASFTVFSVTSAVLASPATAAPREPVYSLVKKEKPALVETLREIVSVESGSRDKAGLDQLATLLASRLTALGGRTEVFEPSASDITRMHDTPNELGKTLVARFEGKGKRRILLLGHMDTVYPRGTLAKKPFRVEGNHAYGPGIADAKSGVAVILHTLAVLKALNFRDYAVLTVAINGDEEVSTPGARKLITQLGAEHDYVFSTEPTQAPRDYIESATSGIAAAMLTVRGRSAHAGVAPEQGRNALMELANQLLQMRDLSDQARGIKFNWTMGNAGTTRNVIPDLATAVADVRVLRVADYDAVERAFRERATSKMIDETKVERSFERRRPPLEPSAGARATSKTAQAIYGELGMKLDYHETGSGAGTDAAFAAASGKSAVLERFGLAGFGFHSSEDEYVELNSIEPRLYLLTRLIMDVSAGK